MNATREQQVVEKIAQHIFGLDTLETQNSDDLDFSEQAVWRIKEALEAAYRAGYSAAKA